MMEKLLRRFFEYRRMIAIGVVAALLAVFTGMIMASCAKRAVRAISGGAAAELGVRLSVLDETVTEGGVFKAGVESIHPVRELSGQFKGKRVRFYPLEQDGGDGARRFEAMVGIEFGAEPGPAEFTAKVCVDTGKPGVDVHEPLKSGIQPECVEAKLALSVKKGTFPSETLLVPPRSVEPTAEDLVEIRRDNRLLGKIYSESVEKVFWDPPITLPVESEITSVYGSNRVYNGKLANSHLGTDFRAPTGTPIRAPITGRVVVARWLFFTGYTVILDHGYDFFTIYGHLSRLKTREGRVLKKGELLGLSGSTGRASGPHLHWGMKLHGSKVDPMTMVGLLR